MNHNVDATADRMTPANQAVARVGRNGRLPPVEHRFQPGRSGNPNGRPPAGATLREWLNVLAQACHTEDEIRQVARDKRNPWPKRAAAERILRALEVGDLADFQPFLNGEASIKDLRAAGIRTEVVKRAKITAKGDREIELHDRAGADFDRVIHETAGDPPKMLALESDGDIERSSSLKCRAWMHRRFHTSGVSARTQSLVRFTRRAPTSVEVTR
jgi:hypothetical protein